MRQWSLESSERKTTLKNNKEKAPVAMRVLGRVRDVICTLAAILIIATVCCFMFGYKPAIVLSGSMEPTIETGSIVLIDKNDTEDIAKGDIIAFNVDNTFITHRVTKIDDEGIHTKGDGNQTADLWVLQQDDVVGKTAYWIPKAGYIASWLTSKKGMIIVVGLCVALIIASFLDFSPKSKQKKKTKKKKEEKKDRAAPEPSTNETGKVAVSNVETGGKAGRPSSAETGEEASFWEAAETQPQYAAGSASLGEKIKAARAVREMSTNETNGQDAQPYPTNETAAENQVSHVERKAGEEERPRESETKEDTVSHAETAGSLSADEKEPEKIPEKEDAYRIRRNADGKLYIGNTYIPEDKEEFQSLEKSRQKEILDLLGTIREKQKNINAKNRG